MIPPRGAEDSRGGSTGRARHDRISRLRQIAYLAGFVALCFSVAAVAGRITAVSVTTWYPGILKPAWNPPAWVFAPVWTTLYLWIAIAGWLVWRATPGVRRIRALRLWFLQLALNFAWTPLFFGLRMPGIAAAEILVLWLAVGAFTFAARRVSKPAAALFVPYWAWVTFAAALNIAIWRMNPG